MPEHGHGHHEPPDTSKGYEQSDLQIGGIVKGVAAYFIFTALVGVFVLALFIVFHQSNQKQADMGPTRIPPQPFPLLQNDVTAHTDIWNLRQNEQYLLENVTYVDKGKGIVRIPIDEAIDREAVLGPKGQQPAGARPQTASVTVQAFPSRVVTPLPVPSVSPEPPLLQSQKPGPHTIPAKPGHAIEIKGGQR